MRFAKGRHRIVILTKKRAIKIAKIHIFYCLTEAVKRLSSFQKTREYLERNRNSITRSLIQYILTGLFSNLYEYKYWTFSHDAERVVPVLKKYLFGLIIVQIPGDSVTEEELASSNPLGPQFNDLVLDTHRCQQFCKIAGKIRLADYGHPPAYELLMKTFKYS